MLDPVPRATIAGQSHCRLHMTDLVRRILQGETSVRIMASVREKDVFVIQSGSPRINDTIMELLIMISACKGGSATKITGEQPQRTANCTAVLLTEHTIIQQLSSPISPTTASPRKSPIGGPSPPASLQT